MGPPSSLAAAPTPAQGPPSWASRAARWALGPGSALLGLHFLHSLSWRPRGPLQLRSSEPGGGDGREGRPPSLPGSCLQSSQGPAGQSWANMEHPQPQKSQFSYQPPPQRACLRLIQLQSANFTKKGWRGGGGGAGSLDFKCHRPTGEGGLGSRAQPGGQGLQVGLQTGRPGPAVSPCPGGSACLVWADSSQRGLGPKPPPPVAGRV